MLKVLLTFCGQQKGFALFSLILGFAFKPLVTAVAEQALQSRLERIELSLSKEAVRGNLANRLELQFSQLQDFSNAVKRGQNGNVLHYLEFVGLDGQDKILDELLHKLVALKVPNGPNQAFINVMLKPEPKAMVAGKRVAKLCLWLEYNPAQVKVIVQQAAGQNTVAIEVFNRLQLKELASGRNSRSMLILAYAERPAASGAVNHYQQA